MPFKIDCPHCGTSHEVADERAGQTESCERCGEEFDLVPESRVLTPGEETELESARSAEDLPSAFGRYKVVRKLGKGAMGVVYLARDDTLNRFVALKVPLKDYARFHREASVAAQFHHNNFCPIYDVGVHECVPFLVMAYIEGTTLADRVVRGRPWEPRRAVTLVRTLALALADAHRKGVIHRDLKPANIMIDREGRTFLMDFGLARQAESAGPLSTADGTVLGTATYMPPEQARGRVKEVDRRSDIYSLGVILYELLAGRPPFEAEFYWQVLAQVVGTNPPPPSEFHPGLDPGLEAVVLKAMAKEPAGRYDSMDEFAGALKAWLDEPSAPKVPDSRDAGGVADAGLPGPAVLRNPGNPTVAPSPDRGRGVPPTPATRPHSQDDQGRPRPPTRSRIVAAAFAALLLGIIIYVATDKGRIKIEVNDPAAVVFVDKEIRVEGLGDPIALRAGEHELSVKRGDVEVEARKFVVRRGDNPALVVTLEPIKVPPVEPIPTAVAKVEPPPSASKAVEVLSKPRDPSPSLEPAAVAKVDPPSPPPVDEIPPPRPPSPKVDDTLITNSLGMKLKLISAGDFLMGSDATDPDAQDDEKVAGKKHPVRITRRFYLGTTEVTVGQFRQFVEKANYKTDAEKDGKGGYGWDEAKKTFERDPKYTWRSPGFPQTDDHPVTNVSWNDAVAFCEWLSREEGQTYRLPTEAEWEYTCRAGRTTRYYSGDDPESLATVGNVADGTAKEKYPDWTHAIKAKDGYVFTAPVGSFQPPNKFGLFDMHGNVWEWCADWYDSDYYAKSPPADPLNSSPAAFRVIRGGCWRSDPRDCRSAYRNGYAPGNRLSSLGFRVARVRSGP